MNRMIQHLLLALAVSTFTVAVTACGSDADSADGSDTTRPDTTDPDTTVPDTTDTTSPDDPDPDPPLGGGSLPVATIDITITHPDTDPVSYTISCLGDTATITSTVGEPAAGLNGFTACERLGEDAVRTRLVEGPPSDRVCTEIYGGPDVAKIVGTYDGVDGVPVDTTIDRANGCGIDEWDVLMAGILPKARGITD